MHIPDIQNLIIASCEKLLEALSWIEQIRKPNEMWEILLISMDKLSPELNLISLLPESSFYK
jgi:hypothetical protein